MKAVQTPTTIVQPFVMMTVAELSAKDVTEHSVTRGE